MGEQVGLILRVVHIFCGVFWAGAAIMLAGFIEPALGALGPEGGKFMQRMMGPGRFGLHMTTAGLLTTASGLAMWWLGSGGEVATWLASGYGRAIATGSVPGLIGLVSGLTVNALTAARLPRIGREVQSAGGPPGADQFAEISRQQRRLHLAGPASAFLLGLSVVAMAAAHYLEEVAWVVHTSRLVASLMA
jgi:hypothetical protein